MPSQNYCFIKEAYQTNFKAKYAGIEILDLIGGQMGAGS
jgi:hypothetical protein